MSEPRVLGEFVSLQRGQSYKGDQVGKPGPYLLGLGTIERNGGFRSDILRTYGGDTPKSILLSPGDLYVSLKDVTHAADLLGAVALVPTDLGSGRLTQDTIRLDVDERNIDRRFLYWLLRSPQYRAYCRTRGTGTTNLDLSRDDFLSYEFELPDRAEQQSIADVLGALDDKIAANTVLATTAESLAVALAARVRPTTPLGDHVAVARTMLDPRSITAPCVDLYSLPGFDAGRTPERVEPSTIKSGKFAISRPAVLVSKLNPRIPRLWEVPVVGALPVLASTEYVVLHPSDTTTAVLWALVSQPPFSAALESKVAGTSGSHQRVKPDDVLSTLVGNPAALTEHECAQIDGLTARAHAARAESVALAATRDSLLPGLMSGKLRVRDAERLAEELT